MSGICNILYTNLVIQYAELFLIIYFPNDLSFVSVYSHVEAFPWYLLHVCVFAFVFDGRYGLQGGMDVHDASHCDYLACLGCRVL